MSWQVAMPGWRCWRGLLQLFLVLLTAFPLSARIIEDSQFVIHNWETEDGMPENSATAMVQFENGDIWYSTFNGLVMFDGVDHLVAPLDLPSRSIVNMHLDLAGRLWISTSRGLVVYNDVADGTRWTPENWPDAPVRNFINGPDGGLYLTSFNARIFQLDDNRLVEISTPPRGSKVDGYTGFADVDGSLMVVQSNLWARWRDGQWEELEVPFSLETSECGAGPARDGGGWVINRNQLARWKDGQWVERIALTKPIDGFWSLHEDRSGRIWVCSFRSGLYLVERDGSVRHFNQDQLLSHKMTRFMFEDQSGNHWVGTSGGGLMLLREKRVRTPESLAKLPERIIKSVSATSSGEVLVGTYGGGLWKGRMDAEPARMRIEPPDDEYVRTLLVDASGLVWAALEKRGLFTGPADGPLRPFPLPAELGQTFSAIYQDATGTIWVGGNSGLVAIRDGVATEPPLLEPRLGVVYGIRELQNGAGHLVVGSGGLFLLKDSTFTEVVQPDGYRVAKPVAVQVLADGQVWVGSFGDGLFKLTLDPPRFARVSLPPESVFGLEQDAEGILWLATGRGILRLDPRVLETEQSWEEISYQQLGFNDGMISIECAGGQQPTIARDTEGNLWFATLKGVAVVQPGRFELNSNPVKLAINSVRFTTEEDFESGQRQRRDRRVDLQVSDGAVVDLPPGSRRIAVHYSGQEFVDPRGIRYQAYLDGYDSGWYDEGDHRVVYYQQLPPGSYQFRLRAMNGDRFDSGEVLSFGLVQLPFFWQTWWFRGAAVMLILCLLVGLTWMVFRGRATAQRVKLAEWQRFHEVLENTSDAVGFATTDRRFFYINRSGRKMLGLKDDESPAKLTPKDLYPPDVYEQITNVCLPTIYREGVWQGFSRVRGADGREVPVWQVLMLHRKPDGEPDFVSSIGRDMTELMEAQKALQVSEDRFSKAFFASPDSITITRMHDGRLLEVNEGFERFFGWSKEEVIGRTTLELNLWESRDDRGSALERLQRDGRVRDLELRYNHRSGRTGVGVLSMERIQLQGEDAVVTIVRDVTDRRHAEMALETSRNMLQQVLNSIPVRVFWKDLELKYMGCNLLFAQDAGESLPENLIGRSDHELAWSEQAELYRADDRQVLESGESRLNYEEPQTTPTGEHIWLLTSKVPLKDAAGNIVGVLGAYENITDRKIAEQALEASRNRLKEVLDAIPVRVFWKDRESRYQGANFLCALDVGLDDPEEMIGQDDFAFSLPEEARLYREKDRRVLETGRSVLNIVEPKTLKDGSQRWLRTSKVPMRDAAGNITGLLGVYEDITDQLRVQQDLQKSEEKLRLAMQASTMGIWEWDIRNNSVIWSDKVAGFFGVELSKFKNNLEDYQRRIHPEDLAMVQARIQEALVSPDLDYHVEHRIIQENGTVRWIEARGRVFLDDRGRPERMVGTVWEVADRKLSEANLIRLAQGVSGVVGETLYQNIVQTMMDLCGADFVFLGRISEDGKRVRSFASCQRKGTPQVFDYVLAGSPCENAVNGSVCVHEEGVQALFPRDEALKKLGITGYAGAALTDQEGRANGMMAALFTKPMARPKETQSILEILASAASSELQRAAAEAALKRANVELEDRVRVRTDELQRLVNLMAGREIRMTELKEQLRELEAKLKELSGNGSST